MRVGERQHVQGTVHPIDGAPRQHARSRVCPEVWLPELDTSQDADAGELASAAVNGVEVPVKVEGRQRHTTIRFDQGARECTHVAFVHEPLVLVVKMFREHERRQADPLRTGTHPAHQVF